MHMVCKKHIEVQYCVPNILIAIIIIYLEIFFIISKIYF